MKARTTRQGTDPGAPIIAGIGRKLIWTTLVATVIFGIVALVYRSGGSTSPP